MKKIVLLAGIFCTTFGFGQKQNISPVQATTAYHLYPQSLYGLQWIENSDEFIWNHQWQTLRIASAQNPKQTRDVQLLAAYPSLQYVPQITHIDKNNLVFKNDNSYEFFNYTNFLKEGRLTLPKEAENEVYNPIKKAVAYTIENNLYLATSENQKIAITHFSDKNIVSGQSIHRNEFGIKKGIFWSPKANFIAFYQKDESQVTSYPLVATDPVPAQLNAIKYPMAGQKSERAKVGIFNIASQKTIYLDIDTSDEHYLTNLAWAPNEKFILLAEINRDQNSYELNSYDVSSGKKIKTLFTESNEKWVEPENPAVFLPNNSNEFLWLSQKDGFMNVYHYNTNGKLIKQVTKFRWVVNEILGFDANATHFFISGTGDDPRQNKAFKIHLKNGKVTPLTSEKGTHQVQINHNGSYFIDEYNSLEIPNKIAIGQIQNGQKTEIFSAENPLQNYNLGSVELLTLKAEDNTPLYAKIIKPHNFDPTKKYPVFLYVYGGPHNQLVTDTWTASTDLWQLAMASADQYIIFTLDNRGSSNRGFAFESAIHRNLATYSVKDQLTAVNYLKSLPYVDANRFAVYGWSFGGFLTSSLMLRHPNTFKVAVAGGAVTNWNFYEVMYGERYMDTPQQNPEGYADTQISKYIPNLNGKLLYIHGYIDDVVVPQHTFEVMESAIKNGKIIDTFFYPKHKHNVMGADRSHLIHRVHQYIIENNK